MARNLGGFLVLIAAALIYSSALASYIFQPISDSHRSAALELFNSLGGSFPSVEETYEELRTFEVLGIDKRSDISTAACQSVSEILGSSSSTLKDLFYALKVNGILKCDIKEDVFEGVASRLQAAVSGASALLDFYYSVGGLALIKGQTTKDDLYLADAEGVFQSIKALSQSDGRWRYNSNNPESSTLAAGLALEALAGIVSLSSSEIDQSLISTTKNDILKLFDSIEKYDDGAFYFDEKLVGAREHQGALSTTSSVVRGLTAFAAVASGSLNLPSGKILGLAKIFLAIGIPGDAKDLFNQVDSLAFLESNTVSIPLILSLPATVLSLTKKDALKVKVNTVLGSNAPPLTVNLLRVFRSGSKDTLLTESQELKFDPENAVYTLDALPKSVDVGKYTFVFETVLHDSDHKNLYATGGQTRIPIFFTGVIEVDTAEIAVLDSDLGSIETKKKIDLAGDNTVSLSANHLQKLRLSFQLSTPLGHAFKPHQAILKLTHETKVEHIFLMRSSGKQFEIILDFLGMVEKFFYLSGRYNVQLTVGDAVMENSFLKAVGHINLDLPEPPEKAPQPPAQPLDPNLIHGPKAEIAHIFRVPEKLPPKELSLTFLGLTLLPFLGFLLGLLRLGVNLKNFPSSSVPAMFAALFHLGIAAVLLLYVLFWLKLDLFTTLKGLGFLGAFLMFVGHRILSHLASSSSKLKSA
ncbi:dolichyl-diphosphooligosaccharide--protein glycosyltransferase subunit 2 [Populus alba]|uniref:Dolichyl-diphosphooligosaccharide--protein glycosyltransferase subunit 2 n=2 Tax=Populus TaxID=3689 RepID=A0A4V6A8Y2_POPAL|nr:dolichyl-diphosphooligosaccharide--protein glycosyltransferase subunit 2-like [Populus alba]KAJ6998616.1 dolichyl-diphosphooligosaccharide--protein glycosyltransferase subunit 2-like [Populus alba x Populus x berolinensis]TKS03386.1 ribophorin 2 family protein [Populus alba]